MALRPSDAGGAPLGRQVARLLVACEIAAVAAVALAISIDLADGAARAAVLVATAGVLALLSAPLLALAWIALAARSDRGRLAAYAIATLAVTLVGALLAR